MGNVSKKLRYAKTNKQPWVLWFINMSEEEESPFLSPFYSNRYFSQPKDVLITSLVSQSRAVTAGHQAVRGLLCRMEI